MLGDPAGLSYENRDLPIGYKSFNDRHRRQLNYIKTPKEDELGISKHTYYAIGTKLSYEAEWEPVGVVGLTDIGAVGPPIS